MRSYLVGTTFTVYCDDDLIFNIDIIRDLECCSAQEHPYNYMLFRMRRLMARAHIYIYIYVHVYIYIYRSTISGYDT